MLFSKIHSYLFKNAAKVHPFIISNFHTSNVVRNKKNMYCKPIPVAIILCGCGGLDGTEIAEAISLAINCSENDLLPRFYAPDIDICGVVDHLTREPDSSNIPRNALVEAARMSRPTIKPLCECEPSSAEALIIPGGFGAARTLSNFLDKGADCTVIPELRDVIEDFSCERKPIGTLCIASALVAKVLTGVKVTLGKEGPKEDWPYAAAIQRVKGMGAKVEPKDVTEFSYCKHFNVFSNPAWLYGKATYADIHEGIGNMISKMKTKIIH